MILRIGIVGRICVVLFDIFRSIFGFNLLKVFLNINKMFFKYLFYVLNYFNFLIEEIKRMLLGVIVVVFNIINFKVLRLIIFYINL